MKETITFALPGTYRVQYKSVDITRQFDAGEELEVDLSPVEKKPEVQVGPVRVPSFVLYTVTKGLVT